MFMSYASDKGLASKGHECLKQSITKTSEQWEDQGKGIKARACSSRGSEYRVSQKKTSKVPACLKIGAILEIIEECLWNAR